MIDTNTQAVQDTCNWCGRIYAAVNRMSCCDECHDAPLCGGCGEPCAKNGRKLSMFTHPMSRQEELWHDGCLPKVFFINVHAVSLAYGGSEEGGWWFDIGELLCSNAIDTSLTQDQIRAEMERLQNLFAHLKTSNSMGRTSVAGGEDIVATFSLKQGENYPQERPQYE